MSSESTRQLIDQAVAALQAGNAPRALELLDRAVQISPDSAEIYGLRGVAFAQTGRVEPATESLRKASMLEPSAKTFYNLSVHLFNIGDKAEALGAAEEALKLNPDHAGAMQLMLKIAGKDVSAPFSADGKAIEPGPLAFRPGYDTGVRHVVPFLGFNQAPWKALGWTIVALSVISVILVKIWLPLQAPVKLDEHDIFMGYKPIKATWAVGEIVFFVTMIIASMTWTLLDLIDRRGRAIWMVPMMICCFLFLPCLPQAFYMFAGRREQ